MKHVKSLNKPMNSNLKKSGCGECQTSCQSACKTSCTVGIRLANRTNNLKSYGYSGQRSLGSLFLAVHGII